MKFIDDVKIPEHPYPELRKVLSAFVDETAAELRENLVGIYEDVRELVLHASEALV